MRPHCGARGGVLRQSEEELIEFNGHERLICEEGFDESDDENS